MPHSHLLMVTREHLQDRRYGLGRSLLPVVDELGRRDWTVRYLCQHDLPAPRQAIRQRWLQRLGRLPGIYQQSHRQQLLGAWAERLDMGWLAAQIARQEGFSHVHLHDPWIAVGFRWGAKLLRLKSVRWGVTEHGFGSYSRATHDDGLVQGPRVQRLLRRIEAATLAAADWVVAPTRLSLEQLARDLALPTLPAHWRVIPHAIQTIPQLDKATARAALGWPMDGMYILGVGRLVPLKRFDLLMSAFTALAGRYPRLQLFLLGDGDRHRLQQQADAAGLGNRLGFAVTDDVTPYLRAADVYVSTSATESFGLANLEALAAGLPAICTAVGGVPEVVGDGAWLIPGNPAVLERVLNSLLGDADARQMLGARGLHQAACWPNLATITDAYAALYQE